MAEMRNDKGRRLDSTARIQAAIDLMATLTVAPGGMVNAEDLERELSLSSTQLDEIITTVQTLADSGSGARAVILREGDDVILEGDAGEITPLRLTEDEAAAVRLIIDRCGFDSATRLRIERALMPSTRAKTELPLGADPLFGGFYRQIIEAIWDGVRCRILYRAASGGAPSERLIDPDRIEMTDDAAYLIAWNVQKDAQRRYRLDRIAGISYTDDSVEIHPFRRFGIAESLTQAGSQATLKFSSRKQAELLGWAGLGTLHDGKDGTVEADLGYGSESWLFDQILAAGGSVEILEPRELRLRLRSYAQALII